MLTLHNFSKYRKHGWVQVLNIFNVLAKVNQYYVVLMDLESYQSCDTHVLLMSRKDYLYLLYFVLTQSLQPFFNLC